LTSFSVTVEASHLPLEPDPAIAGVGGSSGGDWSYGRWSLEIGRQKLEEGVKKKERFLPFYRR
jgi:hypothetical protein